jgi:MFS family permease
VVTAYALSFGSLLLVGGRLGDMFRRKSVFITGLVGFAIASAIGGAAGSFVVLVTWFLVIGGQKIANLRRSSPTSLLDCDGSTSIASLPSRGPPRPAGLTASLAE